MQPADNTPTPTPPEPKQSFWSKLFSFGKKPKEEPKPLQDSLAPLPRLDDPADTGADEAAGDGVTPLGDASVPTAPPQTDPKTAIPTTSEEAAPAGEEAEKLPPTLDVPPSVQGTPTDENDGVPPTLPTESPNLPPSAPPTPSAPQEPPVSAGEDPNKQP